MRETQLTKLKRSVLSFFHGIMRSGVKSNKVWSISGHEEILLGKSQSLSGKDKCSQITQKSKMFFNLPYLKEML